MKRIFPAAIAALLMLVPFNAFAQVSPVPPLMNFQARLAKPDGTPLPDGTYTVTVSLWDIATGGSIMTDRLWTETETVTVRNGVFSALLGKTTALTGGLFNNAVYLEVQVGTDAPLAPRQQLVTVAHAFKADVALSVPPASITNSNIVSLDYSKITNVPAGVGPAWTLSGNAGTDPLTNFLGAIDNQPLNLRVNNQRVMQYSYSLLTYDTVKGYTYEGNNVLGGHSGNHIKDGVVAATIAGGGLLDSNGLAPYANYVSDLGGAIGGGINNSAGNDNASLTDAAYATVGGGTSNQALGFASTIGGGQSNTTQFENSTVGGGGGNFAFGAFSTVPGGYNNAAYGKYSFAAGNGAQANHDGAFVFADSQPGNAVSFAPDEMILRFQNGLGLYSNYGGAGANLSVRTGTRQFGVGQSDGTATISTYVGVSSAGGPDTGWLGTISNSPLSFFVGNSGPLVTLSTNGGLGIGTTTPQTRLDVNGDITSRGTDFDLIGRGGGVGNNGGRGRALVDNGTFGLVLNFGNDFGSVTVGSGMNVIGGVTSHFVNIVGGSDVAEPYTVAPVGGVKPIPGMVVVMDEAHTGQMKVATQAYDGTVGGIISGANGINPGITLTQKGTIADGSMPVASVGRVWCWCDADANGPIKLGSLLTTSNTPGYAMRVTDFAQANGATIGKAMSTLKSGKGLVLVLVSLK